MSGGDGQRQCGEGGEGRGGGGQAALSFCSVCGSLGWDAGAVKWEKIYIYFDICEGKQTFWAASVTSVCGVETVSRACLTVGLRTGGFVWTLLTANEGIRLCEMYAIDTASSVCCCKTVWAVYVTRGHTDGAFADANTASYLFYDCTYIQFNARCTERRCAPVYCTCPVYIGPRQAQYVIKTRRRPPPKNNPPLYVSATRYRAIHCRRPGPGPLCAFPVSSSPPPPLHDVASHHRVYTCRTARTNVAPSSPNYICRQAPLVSHLSAVVATPSSAMCRHAMMSSRPPSRVVFRNTDRCRANWSGPCETVCSKVGNPPVHPI